VDNFRKVTIQVRFFASIREIVGRAEATLHAEKSRSARQVWSESTGVALPRNALVAINQEYAALDAPVQDGDEVAFFPPVTGG